MSQPFNLIHLPWLMHCNIYLRLGMYIYDIDVVIYIIVNAFRQSNLLEWLRKLQIHYHSPHEFKRYDLCVTNGSMEGLSKVFELVLNPTDPILVDSPCYSGSLDFVCDRN